MLNEKNELRIECIDGIIQEDQQPCGALDIQVPQLTVDDLRKSISFAVKDQTTGQTTYSVFLVARNVIFATVETYTTDSLTIVNTFEPTKEDSAKYRRLMDIDDKLKPIALFLSIISNRLYVFFGFDKEIKYCFIDDVRKQIIDL